MGTPRAVLQSAAPNNRFIQCCYSLPLLLTADLATTTAMCKLADEASQAMRHLLSRGPAGAAQAGRQCHHHLVHTLTTLLSNQSRSVAAPLNHHRRPGQAHPAHMHPNQAALSINSPLLRVPLGASPHQGLQLRGHGGRQLQPPPPVRLLQLLAHHLGSKAGIRGWVAASSAPLQRI